MSVIVKGVSMPAKCDDCPFQCNSGGMWESGEDYCTAIPEQHNTPEAGLPDWCPLIELPEHGRLIDADAMLKKYVTDPCGLDGIYDTTDLPEMLHYMPTVIPADKEADNG